MVYFTDHQYVVYTINALIPERHWGYAPTEIPALILRHNLYGLEICPRAAQLAELALVFKAREKSRSFFQHLVRPHIIELHDICFEEGELSAYFKAIGSQPSTLNPQLLTLLRQFEEAKNFGSLIQPCLSEAEIIAIREKLSTLHSSLATGDLMIASTHLKVLRVLEQAEALTQRYHVVVANPPYMGSAGMNGLLRRFGEDNYPDSKTNSFAQFIERSFSLVLRDGYSALVVMESWMFLASFSRLRKKILEQRRIQRMTHMANMVMGIAFGTCATIFKNGTSSPLLGHFCYVALDDLDGENEPTVFPPLNRRNVIANTAEFSCIPGSPIAYWLSTKARLAFQETKYLKEVATTRVGMATGDNDRYVRMWFEVEISEIGFGLTREKARQSSLKWFPYSNGGEARKWYANYLHVVDWKNDGHSLQNELHSSGRVRAHNFNLDKIFHGGLTWSLINAAYNAIRILPEGFLFSSGAPSLFPHDDKETYVICGYYNSAVAALFLNALNPTVNNNSGDADKLPYNLNDKEKNQACEIVSEMVSISRNVWDSNETSWDFRDQPLLRPGLKGATLEASWRNWEAQSTVAIRRMQELETENNRLFIAAYGLDGELQPEVPEAQITLARAEARRDMAAFLSYTVGCMMGRYSLDAPGMICANAGDTVEDYVEKIASLKNSTFNIQNSTFHPDTDAIIPVLDGEWFEDDIVARTRNFLRATFGEAKLNENLRFIEESLGKSLEKYFLTDFYKDHLQTYKKRPIYWMFASPNRGFSALVYLHRYTKDTCNTLLNKYLRDFIRKLESRIAHLTQAETAATNAREKTAARKESDKLRKTLKECQEWERDTLLPLAQQRIELDLDDGVKTNYQKFPGLLVKIPGLDKKEED